MGRFLLDSVSEAILSVFFFVLGFVSWSIRWSVATVFFLLVMAAAGYYVFTQTLEGGQHVVTPAIVDLSINEAASVLAQQGLSLGPPVNVPHQTVPKYHIIEQRPPSGRVVRTGRQVFPTVSMGPDFLKAPDLQRLTMQDAQAAIREARFRLGSVARVPDDAPVDTVLSQDPPAGSGIASQGAINLLVSAGDPNKQGELMPDLRGLGVDEVNRVLSGLAVTIVPREVDIPDAQEDVVINQEPAPDSLVYAGQTVVYYVKPSGRVALLDTRSKSEVRHEMTQDWYASDVRVELVDHRGTRQTVFTKPPLFDEASRARYVAGAAIRLPVSFVQEATVEIVVDGVLIQTYNLKADASAPQ